MFRLNQRWKLVPWGSKVGQETGVFAFVGGYSIGWRIVEPTLERTRSVEQKLLNDLQGSCLFRRTCWLAWLDTRDPETMEASKFYAFRAFSVLPEA